MEYYENLDLADIKYFCEIDLIEKVEQWLPVMGFEGSYEISDLGRVKSLKRIAKHNYGGFREVPEKILSQGNKRYCRVVFSVEAKHFTFLVHRLVGINFIPNPENKATINHKKGNRKDNRKISLEWNTIKENANHSYDTGLSKTHSEKHHSAKLKNSDIPNIIEKCKNGFKQCDVAKMYNVSDSTISAIITKRKWNRIK